MPRDHAIIFGDLVGKLDAVRREVPGFAAGVVALYLR